MELIKRICLRDPIPEIFEAASKLDAAVSAHLNKEYEKAEELIRITNLPVIREWTESIWGKKSPYLQYRPVHETNVSVLKENRVKARMPSLREKCSLLERDGHHCRFCGIPVIREEVRKKIMTAYPKVLSWERNNKGQHAAFQAMWVQYDHLLPHAKGGENNLENMVITCAPCNFGRMDYSLEEVGLIDPRLRQPVQSNWDGLERFK